MEVALDGGEVDRAGGEGGGGVQVGDGQEGLADVEEEQAQVGGGGGRGRGRAAQGRVEEGLDQADFVFGVAAAEGEDVEGRGAEGVGESVEIWTMRPILLQTRRGVSDRWRQLD